MADCKKTFIDFLPPRELLAERLNKNRREENIKITPAGGFFSFFKRDMLKETQTKARELFELY